MSRPLSGLQKEVLGLYRTILREAAKKDRQAAQVSSLSAGDSASKLLALLKEPKTASSYARSEFRKQVGLVRRNDFKTIEHKIRYGYKQVKLMKMPGVKLFGGT